MARLPTSKWKTRLAFWASDTCGRRARCIHKSDPSAHTAQPTCDSLASGYPWFLRPTPSTSRSPFLSHSRPPILLLPLGVCLWANLSGNGDLSSPARPSSDVATPLSIATRSTTAPSSSPVSADLRRRPALPTLLPSHGGFLYFPSSTPPYFLFTASPPNSDNR